MSNNNNAGILGFVRGLDLSSNPLDDDFGKRLRNLANLHWIKLNKTQLEWMPSTVTKITKLENLSVARNNLAALREDLSLLTKLQSIIARRNQLTLKGLPGSIFLLQDLATLDLSWNQLVDLPADAGEAKGIRVLSLGHNKLTNIPSQLLINCPDIQYLDISHNKIDNVPPQLRRLAHIEYLNLSHNPLEHAALRSLCALSSLGVLNLSGTQRTMSNMPDIMDQLTNLIELDLSQNRLTDIPPTILKLVSLRRLNMASNEITHIPESISGLENVQTLNFSSNSISALPASLFDIRPLRRLYVNRNKLTSKGFPDLFHQCTEFEVLMAGYNELEDFPKSLLSCPRLSKIILNDNCIKSIPVEIYRIESQLKTFNLDGNDGLQMPQRPKLGSLNDTYNIDFLSQAIEGALTTGTSLFSSRDISINSKKATSRSQAVLRNKNDEMGKGREADTAKVLEGMKKISAEKDSAKPAALLYATTSPTDDTSVVDESNGRANGEPIKNRSWKDTLEKPKLDYSEIYGHDVGKEPGVSVWRIENFLPMESEPELFGKFYEGDCYIVLKTFKNDQGNPDYSIWFWIGEKSTLDKKASAAIHAVNLRNYLNANCMTSREEQGDEGEDFLKIFDNQLSYIEGGTESGFYIVEQTEYVTRLFRIIGGKSLMVFPLEVSHTSLHVENVYLLDAGLKMWVWAGSKSKLMLKSKALLLAEKISKNERGNKVDIKAILQGEETKAFWNALLGTKEPAGGASQQAHASEPHSSSNGHLNGNAVERNAEEDDDDLPPPLETSEGEKIDMEIQRSRAAAASMEPAIDPSSIVIDSNPKTAGISVRRPNLYKVALGKGFLELPQVDTFTTGGNLVRSMLESSFVYILDAQMDTFIWVGRKSSRLVRAAALKLSEELMTILQRPNYAIATKVLEMAETQIFKSYFSDWDDAIAVDFSALNIAPPVLTVKQIQNREKAVVERPTVKYEPPKVDLRALFAPRPRTLTEEDADLCISLANDRLEKMECFVLEGKKFVRLPKKEVGQFYSGDCYVFLCTYWKVKESSSRSHDNSSDEESDIDEEDERFGGDETLPSKKNAPSSTGSSSSDSDATSKKKSAEKAQVEDDEDEEEQEEEEDIECVVYFWQGRRASPMGWLTFTFSFQKEIEQLIETNFGCDLRVLRTFQQRESLTFLSHFTGKFIIHDGNRPTKAHPELAKKEVQLYHIRCNASKITRRAICEKVTASNLCSEHCYVLKVPFDNMKSGIIYTWIGKKASETEAKFAEQIGYAIKGDSPWSIQCLTEGNEPENFFWFGLGGKKPYDSEADYIGRARLFVCSNTSGYFTVAERNPDFCQDDLNEDDVMILDTGKDVFVWFGHNSSDVEKKLAIKSAQVYIEYQKDGRSVKNLKIAKRGHEPHSFIRCFHGWDDRPRQAEVL